MLITPGKTEEIPPGTPAAAGETSKSIILAALLFGVVAFQLNASMVAPAVPEIARTLHSTLGLVAISQTLFFLTGAIAGIVLTRYSDHAGRKKILIYSLVAMCIGTVAAMLAPSIAVLCAGRLLQGASGSVFQITYLILRDIMTPAQFGPALGIVTAISCGVGGADQFLGGMLSDRWGFRSIFFVILVIGILAIGMPCFTCRNPWPIRPEAWTGSAPQPFPRP